MLFASGFGLFGWYDVVGLSLPAQSSEVSYLEGLFRAERLSNTPPRMLQSSEVSKQCAPVVMPQFYATEPGVCPKSKV